MAIPAPVGTSTSTLATAYGYARKSITFNNGNMMDFFYDGAAIVCRYLRPGIDASWQIPAPGGTVFSGASLKAFSVSKATEDESVHVVYIPSVGYAYYVRGIPDAPRTGITWGTPYIIDSTTSHMAIDCVAHVSGANHIVHTVRDLGANPFEVRYARLTVNGAGSVSFSGNTLATTVVNVSARPSIAKNAANTQFAVTFNMGSTGAGYGVRACVGSFDGTTMTWGAQEILTEAVSGSLMGPCNIDANGRILAVFRGSDNIIRVYRRPSVGGAWVDISPVSLTAQNPTLTVRAADHYYLLYENSGIVLLEYSGSAWLAPVTIDPDTTAKYPTTRRDTSGYLLDLMYYRKAASPFDVIHYRQNLPGKVGLAMIL